MAKKEEGEGTISFDTAINLDGMEEDVKDLKSMANDIAKSIENMGRNIEKAVGEIDTSGVQDDLNSLSDDAIKAAEASMKVNAAMAKLDDVNGPQAIIAAIKEYKKQLEELELAYAITIHKSQGSEYPAVILPLLSGPQMLLNRNLLYTAVTRARKCVTVVGNEETFAEMIRNEKQQKRYSALDERIRELSETTGDNNTDGEE